MPTATLIFAALCAVAFVLFLLMASTAMRYASRLNDSERNLRTSRQAHALDVQALTLKLQQARARSQVDNPTTKEQTP